MENSVDRALNGAIELEEERRKRELEAIAEMSGLPVDESENEEEMNK